MSKKTLENAIGYNFKSEELLNNALIHSSYVAENPNAKSNERLEFLGDAVLETVISEEIYKIAPELPEGKLSVVRSYIVREDSLVKIASHLNLGEYLKFGIGEQKAGGNQKPSILADAVEALIGAIFLDSNYEQVKRVVLGLFSEKIKKAVSSEDFGDYKSQFQIKIQQNKDACIEYRLDATKGKPNCMEFFVSLLVNGEKISEGTGTKKKEAEQAAAKAALERIF